jgi:hypothetical protein
MKIFSHQGQIKNRSNHQFSKQRSSPKSNGLKVAGISSVQKMIEQMEQLARVEQDKKNRKHRRQQRKNQARRKQAQTPFTTNTTAHDD